MSRVLFALLLAAGFASAADEPKKDAPSPQFNSWAKQKEGTSVTTTETGELGPIEVQATNVTLTLAEVKDGKLVFEVSKAVEGGKPTTKTHEVDRSGGGLFPSLTLDPKTGKPKNTVEEGEEKLKVGDSEFKCRWYKTKADPDIKFSDEERIWVCDTFPGYVVKTEKTTTVSTSSVKATAVTIKK